MVGDLGQPLEGKEKPKKQKEQSKNKRGTVSHKYWCVVIALT